MAENLGEGKVRIVPDTSGFEQGVTKGVTESMDKAEKSVKSSTKNMNEQIKSVGQTIATAFVTTQVINFAKNTVLAAEEAGKADARIKQIATSMNIFGGNVDAVSQRLVDFAAKTQFQVGLDDEIIKSTQAKLLTFKNLAMTADQMGGAFDRATLAAIDMAAAGFGEASNNAVQLGKALQDPIKGITALSRSGITFTAEQKNVIKALVETNQVAAAQDLILQAIEQQVGGTAAATATASDRMKIAWGELQETIGKALLPALEGLTSALIPVFAAFNAVPPTIRNMITTVVLSTTVTAGLSRTLQGLNVSAGVAKTAMTVLNVAMIAYSLYAQQNADNTRNWQAALQKLTGATDEQTAAYLEQMRIAGQLLDKSPVQVFREIAEASVGTAQRLVDLGVAQAKLGISTYEAQAIIDKQTGSLRQQQSDLQKTTELVNGTSSAQDGLASSSSNLAGSQTDLGAATSLTTEEIQQQEEALRSLVDATMASFSSEIALAQQKRTTSDAIAAFNDLQNQVTTGTYRGSDAMRDMVEASEEVYQSAIRQAESAVRLAQDNAKAAGGQLSAAEAARIQRDELMKVVSTLAPDSPLRRELENYIRRLNAVPTQITSRIDTFYTTYERRVQITSSGMGSGRPMANGGIVTGPTRALIGEAGPEVVIPLTRPQRAMELMQQTGLDRMGAGGYASSRNATVNIENAVFQNGTDADLVAQKVNAAEKARSFST